MPISVIRVTSPNDVTFNLRNFQVTTAKRVQLIPHLNPDAMRNHWRRGEHLVGWLAGCICGFRGVANCCVKVHACHKMPLIMLAINFYCLDATARTWTWTWTWTWPEHSLVVCAPQSSQNLLLAAALPWQFMTYMRNGQRHRHRHRCAWAHLESYRAASIAAVQIYFAFACTALQLGLITL